MVGTCVIYQDVGTHWDHFPVYHGGPAPTLTPEEVTVTNSEGLLIPLRSIHGSSFSAGTHLFTGALAFRAAETGVYRVLIKTHARVDVAGPLVQKWEYWKILAGVVVAFGSLLWLLSAGRTRRQLRKEALASSLLASSYGLPTGPPPESRGYRP
jgi:hypothetical protein